MMKRFLIAGVFAALATTAIAHSPLQGTTPVNEAIVTQAPTEIVLDFKGKIRLTRLVLNYGDQPSIDLDFSGYSGFVSDYSVPVQPMGVGVYQIEWRGLGADGHALNGTFSFTVE